MVRRSGLWKSLRKRLRKFRKSRGCRGSLWGSCRYSAAADRDPATPRLDEIRIPGAAAEMNLEEALAAEGQISAVELAAGEATLMKWLEEEEKEEEEGIGEICCVCMGRKKGAAFIPCGHTFCRACARELWIGRRSCAICNRPILEILQIF
ncbi:putative E3 ubiquitin-protein ligase LUL4 [Apostasia shenzhenica]|uniref:Putative E3 ubiquitin-protein ligase LUL4 n=1 Tax=Apostasia shenzhenica TaxID=1088818 RepID=A0A2I0AM36_9ASPA|nr:putative E3 ubiquitin-protein ligase LUL4 [Apostasia shenzhenica]